MATCQPIYAEQPHTPTIGVMANLADFAALAQVVASAGKIVLLDRCGLATALREDALDLLILSPRRDWWDEVDTLTEFYQAAARAHLAVLAMTPTGDVRALEHAFTTGVTDCVPYPIDPAEVAIRVTVLLNRKRTADRLRAEATAMRRLALTDPVTGLWNRHYLDTELAARVATGEPSLSVLMIDIDRFKPINDKHGHAIGDRALRAVATRLNAGIRAHDTLARFGGDELVLMMPDTRIEAATLVAERLRELVADGTTEVPFNLTISVGVAELIEGESVTMLLERADKALYAAKLNGRNRVAAAS